MLRFRIVLAVGVGSFDEDIAFFTDRHVDDTRFEAGNDLSLAEHEYEWLTADVAVDNLVAVADFILQRYDLVGFNSHDRLPFLVWRVPLARSAVKRPLSVGDFSIISYKLSEKEAISLFFIFWYARGSEFHGLR